MVRLLAIDIDGTLLDSRGRLPAAHQRALAAASARGIAIALVTGRSFHFTQPLAAQLDVPLTLIVNNGAAVKTPQGATVLSRPLPRDTAIAVVSGTRTFEDSVAVVFDRSDDRQIVFERMDWSHPHRRGYYEKNRQYIAAAAPLVAAITEDPIQVMFNGGVAPMRALAAELRAMAEAPDFTVALTEYEPRDFSLLDVNAAGCSKGSTLEAWASDAGFPAAEIMAVGDNLNDRAMLEFAGTSIVMGNAVPALRTAGFAVTGTNDEGGLAEAIYRFAIDGSGRG